MNDDLVELVKSSLRDNGCNESLLNNFDGNSTISLDFEGDRSIFISRANEHVVLWSQLQLHNPYILSQCAGALLEISMKESEHSITGHFHFSENDGMTTLESYVKPSSLNTSDFSAALEEFYLQLKACYEALR